MGRILNLVFKLGSLKLASACRELCSVIYHFVPFTAIALLFLSKAFVKCVN